MTTKVLQPYQQRVVDEKNELKAKLDALIEFLQKGKPEHIDIKQWTLLEEQCDAMNHYYTILVTRIEAF